ncbi:hypothetical protein Scep_016146 [Stephania cephalantha]|uniref:Ubiquitin-like domain-containing protein n=1 Tax=Stephania cephalantha TaxID=152367 RepID=A0AAP0IN89_9MAGN
MSKNKSKGKGREANVEQVALYFECPSKGFSNIYLVKPVTTNIGELKSELEERLDYSYRASDLQLKYKKHNAMEIEMMDDNMLADYDVQDNGTVLVLIRSNIVLTYK